MCGRIKAFFDESHTAAFLQRSILNKFPVEAAADPLPDQVPDEQRLYADLMEEYEAAVRPVLNASTTVRVNFRISLNQIVDLVSSH